MTNNTLPSIAIFGAGDAGINALHHLQGKLGNVLAFSDNAEAKHGQVVQGVPVIHPRKLAELSLDKIYIASEFFEAIKSQLISQYHVSTDKLEVLPSRMLSPMQFGDKLQNRQLAMALLKTICSGLQKAELSYFLDAGTLLGIYRDGSLIPWDDDLDLGVFAEDLGLVKRCLEQLMPALNHLSGGTWAVTEHVNAAQFYGIEEGMTRCLKLSAKHSEKVTPMIDIFIKYRGEEWLDYTLASRGIRVKRELVEPLGSLIFEGQLFRVPGDTEGYLGAYYGDWRTPVKNWDLSMLRAAEAK